MGNFRLPLKGGGQKTLDLINFFSMFLKHNFSCFLGILGTFDFLVKGGLKISDASRRGGAKNFRRVIRGAKDSRPPIIMDSLGAK